MQGKRRSRRGMLAAIVVAGAAALTATVAGADTVTNDGSGSRAGIEAPAERFVQDQRAPEGSQDRPGKDCPERDGADAPGAGGSATPESGGTATPTPEV